MEGRGRSRRRSLRREWKRRLSSVLAVVLTAVMILNMPLSIDGLGLHVSDAFASGSNADQEDSVWATASNAKYRQGDSQDVDIYVIANDSGAVPGNTTSMTLYLKNNTDQAISEGVLTFSGKYINKEDASFQDVGSGEEYSQIITAGGPGYSAEESGEGLIYQETDKTALLADETAADVSVTETEAEAEQLPVLPEDPGDGEAEEEESEEAYKLENIDLQPGELHEVYFEFYTEDDVKSTKANVSFSFRGENEEGSRVTGDTKFYYSIGLPNVNFSMEDGMQIESGVKNDLEIWMSEPDWVDEDLEERLQEQEEKKAQEEMEQAEEEAEEDGNTGNTASGSDASRATDSNASKDNTASNSNAAKDDTSDGTLSKEDAEKIDKYTEEAMEISESRVSYTVEIFGAKYSDFHPRKTEEAEDIGWISCVYEVDRETEPGIYYGKVTASGKWNKKDFTTEQGFLFEVTGEGKTGQEFTEELDNVIVHAYAEEGVLPENVQLKATELIENDAETGDQFQTAKDALDAEGTQYDGMMALDITFIDENGEEIEPDGEVQVSIEMKEGVLPEDVDLSTVEVHHLKEVDENTVEVEAVADGADKTDGTVKSADEVVAEMEDAETPEEEIEAAVSSDAAAVASFSVGSFSYFTITWGNGRPTYFNLTVHMGIVSEAGTWQYITDAERSDITVSLNGNDSSSYSLSGIAPTVSGYTYSEARLGGLSGENVTSLTLQQTQGFWPWQETTRTLTFYNNSERVGEYTYEGSNTPTGYSLFMIYTPITADGNLTIQNNIIEDGELTAVLSEELQGQVSTYKWYRSSDGVNFSDAIEYVRFENGTANMSGSQYENINVALDSWQNQVGEDDRFYYKVEALDSNGSIIAVSEPFLVPYYMQLENGSFETPVNPSNDPGSDYSITGSQWANQWSNEVYAANNGVWQTTGEGTGVKDGQDIEIVNVNNDKGKYEWNPQLDFEAADGIQFAELNCERDGALYQDVLTIEGQELNYWLNHRARGKNANGASEYDIMYVVIMPTALALTGGDNGGPVDTQDEVLEYIDGNYEGVFCQEYRSDDQSWHYYENIGGYTATSYLTRFFFVAVEAANSITQGNFLDNVGFSTGLPDVDPGHGNLVITKIVRGLTEEEMGKYKIELKGISDSPVILEDFTNSVDGYVDRYTITNVSAGTPYSISESVPSDVAVSLQDANDGPNVTITVDGQPVNEENASVIIKDGQTHNVVFTNTYQKKAVNITVAKQVEGNMTSLNDSFEFVLSLRKDGSDYTDEISAVVRTTGGDTGEEGTYSYNEGKGGYVFTLKPQQEIVFSAPYGSTWSVEETNNSGYTDVKYLFDGQIVDDKYKVAGSEPLTTAVSITFTNIKNVNTPTGFTSTYYPYLVMLAIAAAGTTSFIYPTYRRRRHKGDR